jgi:hypothetical protein
VEGSPEVVVGWPLRGSLLPLSPTAACGGVRTGLVEGERTLEHLSRPRSGEVPRVLRRKPGAEARAIRRVPPRTPEATNLCLRQADVVAEVALLRVV